LLVGTLPSTRKKSFTNTNFEICAPSRMSHIGFGLSWLAVDFITFGFMYMLKPWLGVSIWLSIFSTTLNRF
jgi:hypothetical protein